MRMRTNRLSRYEPMVLAAVADARDEGLRDYDEVDAALAAWRERAERRARRMVAQRQAGRVTA